MPGPCRASSRAARSRCRGGIFPLRVRSLEIAWAGGPPDCCRSEKHGPSSFSETPLYIRGSIYPIGSPVQAVDLALSIVFQRIGLDRSEIGRASCRERV